jgi:MFS transporter, DHA1 family, multidrug resistance protein
MVGSALCASATNISMLMTARFIQGLGGGACVLWRSMFGDSFKGDELAKMEFYLGTMIIFIVPAAPLLGGVFQVTWGWRASFIFMCIYGMASFLTTIFILEETHDRTQHASLPVFKTFLEILKHPTFLCYVFTVCMTFGAFYAWFVVGPVLWIGQLNHSSISFGVITFIVSAIMMLLASITNGTPAGHQCYHAWYCHNCCRQPRMYCA